MQNFLQVKEYNIPEQLRMTESPEHLFEHYLLIQEHLINNSEKQNTINNEMAKKESKLTNLILGKI